MNNSGLANAKKLRRTMTDTEKILWFNIRAKRFDGVKFKRQVPFKKYVADFASHQKKVIIELDGGQHANNEEDKERDKWFEGQGYKVLRFWNNEIIENLTGVLDNIYEECK